MLNHPMIDRITNVISDGLKRPVNSSFTLVFVKYFQKTGSLMDFITYSQALGFPKDGLLAKEVYNLINDNIGLLTRALDEGGDNTGQVSIKSRTSNSQNNKPIKKRQLKIDLDLEDELEDEIDIRPNKVTSFKKLKETGNQSKGLLLDKEDHDDIFGQDNNSESKTFKNSKPSFKKIKKENAIKIKDNYDEPSMNQPMNLILVKQEENIKPKIKKEPQLSLSELAALEKKSMDSQITVKQEPELIQQVIDDDTNDLENDREWYMAEDFGQAPLYQYEEIEEGLSYQPKRKSNFRRDKDHLNMSGGGFDHLTGQYVDYDHIDLDGADTLSRIQINPHFFIPPFLEESRNYLTLEIASNTNRDQLMKGISSSIKVIPDPESELAISARQGSFVVKENKAKKEKAKQAKDRSSLQGTALGNVLGIEGKTEKFEEPNKEDEDLGEAPVDTLSIQQQRRQLPAFAVRKDLIRAISENQVTIVIGETGSGKTTQLAQFLYEEGFASSLDKNGQKKIIGCTQPRRVAAMSVAKRVSEEMNCKLSEEVGYVIRFEDRTSPQKTVIKYLTEGILLREILIDPNLEDYSCIIMDEAHERTLSTDVLLGLFRKLLMRRKDLKLIVTSATMNADRFTRFFGDAPQFTIPGRTFPVDIMFSKTSCQDYVESAVKQVLTIHLQNSSKSKLNDGDILVFMTGQEDIEVTCELLKEKLEMLDDPPPLDIYPIYSTLPADLQKKIFSKKNEFRRKVVVATNIAETSLTVDGIKYVVDTGLIKMKVYNPKLGMETLQVVPVSVANAQQRSGRAGRTGPGVAYRLYTERATKNDQMHLQPIPEIQRTNLSNVMLLLRSLKVDNLQKFPFLDPPPQDLLSRSLYDLWVIGALDNFGNLTSLGSDMSNFPMEPTLSKLIILSCKNEFHCSEEILTVVSMLSIPSVFFRPKERAQEADSIREKYVIAESDHLTLLNVYNQWQQQLVKSNSSYKKLSIWCDKNFLQIKSLIRAREIRNQLVLIMKKYKLPISKSRSDDDIRKCLCAAYFQQLARLIKNNISGNSQAEYVNLRNKVMTMYLHPTSALNGGTDMAPNFVVYHELLLTTKEYMSCVTAVDPLWLLQYGYYFYGVDEKTQANLKNLIDFELIDKKDFEERLNFDKLRYQDVISSSNKSNKMKTERNNFTEVKNKFNRRRGL